MVLMLITLRYQEHSSFLAELVVTSHQKGSRVRDSLEKQVA